MSSPPEAQPSPTDVTPEDAEAWYQQARQRREFRDFGAAAALLSKAAAAGHPGAMIELGQLYVEGQGVPKDPTVAVTLYRQAIDAGSTDGMNHLGVAYVAGEGVERDPHRAFKLFEQAAEKGDAIGMYNLGITYGRGRGVAADRSVAIEWLRKAAAAGSDAARDWLIKEGVEPPTSPESEPD